VDFGWNDDHLAPYETTLSVTPHKPVRSSGTSRSRCEITTRGLVT
jgi:hypothetical protein